MASRFSCIFRRRKCSGLGSTARRRGSIPGKLGCWYLPTRIWKRKCARRRSVSCKRPQWPMAFCEPPSRMQLLLSVVCCRVWDSRRLILTSPAVPRWCMRPFTRLLNERHRLVSPVDLRHNMGMSNRAIEFHDSTFDGLEKDRTNVTLRFSAAYIHESNGKPGLDAGSGWIQEARLHIAGASLSGEIPELPRDLWDGSIRLGDELYQMTPIPLAHPLHRHYVPDLVVDAFSPELSFRWRRASTFCKTPLKKSTSSVLSASNRFNWGTSLRGVDSREFWGGDSSLGSTGSS